jgi:hypothetical protein
MVGGGGVTLNLSISRNNALALENSQARKWQIHWLPKTTIFWELALTLYKSVGCNVLLYVSVKVSDTQYCKLGSRFKKLL